MDLYAYAQIDNLERILIDNRIEIPRLRGLRLMSEEELMTKEDLDRMYKSAEFDAVDDAVRSGFHPYSNSHEYSSKTDYQLEYFVDFDKFEDDGKINHFAPIKIHWERIHGKKRKLIKWQIRKRKVRIKYQYDMWNKYCGRADVLHIHARLGASNWDYYECDKIIKSQPWYLDHCEDSYDCTYVDIYAKIGE